LSAAWLLVPLGILGLVLLFPLVLGIGYAIRLRRARREFANSGSA
jgi:hypothetical protein